jgi:hypothetical protein
MMILDGFVFGLSIAASYILSYNYMLGRGATATDAGILAGTVSFAITLLSPQIYVFILREGSLVEKFGRRNVMLKSFFVFTLLMILAIIYLPGVNRVFITTPLYDLYLLGVLVVFSLLTTAFRALFGDNIVRGLKRKDADEKVRHSVQT